MVDLGCRRGSLHSEPFCRFWCSYPKGGVGCERGPPWRMHNLLHWVASYASLLAILVTLGVAVLLVCCLECTNCPSREKDDIFSRHGM
jgi:hypothetical protein